MKEKLNYKRNSQAWHKKPKSTPIPLHQSMALHQFLIHHIQNVEVKENLQWQGPMIQLSYSIKALLTLSNNYTPLTFDVGIPLSHKQRIHTVINFPIKRTNTISSSPACNEEQVSLGEYEGQYTSMQYIAHITLQYSKPAHHKAQQEKHTSRQ
ncbi:LOW QUALITY PROTEIN: hypothetical protein Cgig2_032127 [Carnegiea gigantea]|uniref:Uncharacterized protein n=1 Tax=Carnegiea gigantea TaxID=171969 RepID=A0A9Q1JSR8_9CARY|nr:LOW QUALITY PROTEIN: hypothetical protein Cgig2_032127 [Carnegiea gigantea]